MQAVYATHLPLPPTGDAQPLDTAVGCLKDWLAARFGVQIEAWEAGAQDVDDVRVTWESTFGTAGGLVSASIDQPDRSDSNWRWRTYVDLGVEGGTAWLRVRVGLYSPLEGLVTKPRVQAGRPGIVRALADSLDITADGWRVGEWRSVARNQVPAYLDFLLSRDRYLPVVVLSQDQRGETFLDPAHLADRLLGMAHVVTIDTGAAYDVSDRLGRGLSCYLGAVRIYWPGLTLGDDPYHHRLYVGGTLDFLGRDGLEAELFEILGRLAGLSLDEPRLRRRLRVEKTAAEIERRSAERIEAAKRLMESAQSTSGGLNAEEFAEFAGEYDEMRVRVEELEWGALESEIELDRLREERDESRTRLVEIVRELGTQRGEVPEELPPAAPATVLEAVQRAAEASPHVVYLDEAMDSAKESSFPDPTRVLDDLRVIEEIARDWAAGELASGPALAFEQRCSNFRKGISQTAATQYPEDYSRTYEGAVILLGPHLRRGVGSVAAILRIYMYFDDTKNRIVVGHVGRKLRDSSNRN